MLQSSSDEQPDRTLLHDPNSERMSVNPARSSAYEPTKRLYSGSNTNDAFRDLTTNPLSSDAASSNVPHYPGTVAMSSRATSIAPSTMSYIDYGCTNVITTPSETLDSGTRGISTILRAPVGYWRHMPTDLKFQYNGTYKEYMSNDGLPPSGMTSTGKPWGYFTNQMLASNVTLPEVDAVGFEYPSSMSTSSSSDGTHGDCFDSNSSTSSRDERSDCAASEKMLLCKPSSSISTPLPLRQQTPASDVSGISKHGIIPIRRYRHMLPTRLDTPGRPGPIAEDELPATKRSRSSSEYTIGRNDVIYENHIMIPSSRSDVAAKSLKAKPADVAVSKTFREANTHLPSLKLASIRSAPAKAAPIEPDEDETQLRSEQDEFLVASKKAGMSYKEIRRKGNFTEAESTLRGRYRTLTKEPAARVRKPEWEDKDVRSYILHVNMVG